MNTEIFNYNGTNITFQLGNGDVMINATEMAKPFDAKPNDFLKLESTKKYIKAITKKNRISENQLVTTIKGSSIYGGGTWLHEDIAIEYAGWLSLDFKIWCNDKIKELLTKGSTSLQPKSEDAVLLEAMNILNKRIEAKDETIRLQDAKIKENAPKVVFAETVSGSSNSILVREFAKDLCDNGFKIGQNRLFEWFRDNNYLMKDNSPYQNYVDMGLFEVITRSVGSGTETFTTKTTKITGKGSVYFTKKIKESYSLTIMN